MQKTELLYEGKAKKVYATDLGMNHVTRLTDSDMGFCTACFSGIYPTVIPKVGEKDRFERKIHG